MKKLLLLLGLGLGLLLVPAISHAQNTITLQGSGAPTGSCAFIQFYIDSATGNLYDCKAGAWNLTGSGGSGTANIPVNAQSGNYSLQSTDRASYLKWSGGTTATLLLCQIATTCATNFPFVLQNLNTGNLTITANAADSIDGGSTGGSITVGPNQAAFVYQDSTSAPGHWWSLIIPTTSGTATTSLYFILNSTATGTSIGAPTLNATKLWSYIANVTVVHATKIVYAVNTADNSANLYNLALFDTQGNIVAQTGATAGTTFSPSTGQKSLPSTAPFNVYAGVRYYVGLTGNATTALLGGANNHFDALCGAAATSNNTTASAVWTTPIGIPADSVNLVCTEPTFGFYQ